MSTGITILRPLRFPLGRRGLALARRCCRPAPQRSEDVLRARRCSARPAIDEHHDGGNPAENESNERADSVGTGDQVRDVDAAPCDCAGDSSCDRDPADGPGHRAKSQPAESPGEQHMAEYGAE